MFDIDPMLGIIIPVDTDTAVYNFQNLHFTDGMNGEYNHLGNMGSPRQSRIFFNRKSEGQFLFVDALDFFIVTPKEFHFTDTKSPWSNISYYRAGNKVNGEERFKGRFGVNSGKRTGVGFSVDYLYGRGLYDHQSTAYFDGSLYGYHHGERYGINLLYSYDKLRLAENGGIADDRYITNPEAMAEGKKTYRPADMPTNLQRTWNENLLHTALLTQDFSLGYYKARTDSLPDTVIVHRDFIAVSKVFHTMEASTKSRRFIDYADTKNYYMEVANGEGTVSGYWTGKVETKVKNSYLTVPVVALYRINERWNISAGAYASYLIDGEFSGTAYDGYLREGDPTGEKTELESAAYDFSSDICKFQYGVQAGAEYKIYKHLAIFADLKWGLNGIFPSNYSSITFALYPIYGTLGFTYIF
jgi:hypothetical protein